jgi:hypothetical protein
MWWSYDKISVTNVLVYFVTDISHTTYRRYNLRNGTLKKKKRNKEKRVTLRRLQNRKRSIGKRIL